MTYVFVLLVLGLFIYEGIALFNHVDGDTISEIFWHLSQRPLVPFLFGLLCGHFFWQEWK
jgi:hypothetical protein